jgi:hypothetical protein
MIIFKNIFSFALTLKAFDWLVLTGTRATPLFNVLASLQVGVCLLSIPMCKFPESLPQEGALDCFGCGFTRYRTER